MEISITVPLNQTAQIIMVERLNPAGDGESPNLSNSADYYGGAVAYDGCLVQSVEDSVFILNTARNGRDISFAGYDDDMSIPMLGIDNSAFIDNEADEYGGAVDVLKSVAIISGSDFNSNFALKGGALSLRDSAVSVDDCTFEYNLGDELVYNIYNDTTNLLLTNNEFTIIEPTIEVEPFYVYGDAIEIKGTFDWGTNDYPINMNYTINGG